MANQDVHQNLAKQVLETQEGITPEQLKALIEAENPPTIDQATVEPASAPAPQAPASQPAPAPAPTPVVAAPAEPAQGQPNVLDLIPEKFRSKDVPTSLSNITKSYSDLEAELKKQKDEMAQLNNVVKSFMEKEPTYVAPKVAPQALPQSDVDDATFFERPTEAARKVAAQVATAAVMAYHVQQARQQYVNNFRAQHPDFENYRDDMMAILRSRPDLDGSEQNLPMVYEMAKQRYASRLSAMRAELGLREQKVEEPNGQPAPEQPIPNLDEITKAAYLKARNDIIAEVENRRRASGIQGSSAASSPDNRVQPRARDKELTPEDAVLQEMMGSGPKKLSLLGD